MLSASPDDAGAATTGAGATAAAAPAPAAAPIGFPQDGQNVVPSATWVPQPLQKAIVGLLDSLFCTSDSEFLELARQSCRNCRFGVGRTLSKSHPGGK